MTVDCMREQLLEGKKIRLGDLGDFSIVLSSKGAEDADKFTVQNITDVKVLWEPGSEFKNLLAEAEFNLVASRSAQATVIKVIKAGKANVDLSTPTTPGDASDGGGSNPSGDNKGDAGQELGRPFFKSPSAFLRRLPPRLEFRVVWDSVSKQSIRIEIPFLKYFF